MTPQLWDEQRRETAEAADKHFLTLEETQPGYFVLRNSAREIVYPPGNFMGGEVQLKYIRSWLHLNGYMSLS